MVAIKLLFFGFSDLVDDWVGLREERLFDAVELKLLERIWHQNRKR